MSSKKLTLRSSDGETFEIDEAVALQSETIKMMVEADDTIPLPNVSGRILAMVIEYLKKHVDEDKESKDEADKERLKKFDKDFMNVELGLLSDLMMAAHYLNIKGLLDLTCQTVADMICLKSPEQIRKIFGLSEEEEHADLTE